MSIPTVTFKAIDLPIQSVTVFRERAQVKRELSVHLEEGRHELVIENLPWAIDRKSIRVDVAGNVEIHEVVYMKHVEERKYLDSPELKRLDAGLDQLLDEKCDLEDQKSVLQRQLDTLNIMSVKLSGSSSEPFVLDEDVEDKISKFFVFYDKKALALMEEIRKLEEAIKELWTRSQLEMVKIDDLRTNLMDGMSRNISITVDVAEEGDLTFVLTYQVIEASWHPVYDIRVMTPESAEEATTLNIDYFAEIVQDTGEEWTDTKILLSTAQPSQGGNVPELGTFNVSFYRPPKELTSEEDLYYGRRRAFACADRLRREREEPKRGVEYEMDYELEEELESEEAVPEMAHRKMTASQQVLSTEFQLPEKKTIPSDNSEHKMLITHVAFEPSLLHECVPKKSTNVFLTASVVNNSEFPLLEGDASVYLNHSFVAKTHLKAVAPGEKFTCSLGVDNAVKVTYKAPQKFNSESGMFTKQATVSNTQTITIQNNKSDEEITVVVREHIPKPTDEKIKVRVLQPTLEVAKNGQLIEKPSSDIPVLGCILNTDHNLEWTEKIKEGEKKELVVKWQLDYPSTEAIEYNES
uniref:DUF4139 domain-containing protein n=1 Tax=Steinernema glaseri TaxID=37863 RepID=A0A1I7Z8J9_9BILA